MSYEAIREQVAAILGAVDGIGVVHQYLRWAVAREKFNELFKDESTGGINAWNITRRETPEKWLTNIEHIRVYEFIIRGVYGLNDSDASELTFQSLIEDICAAFRNNSTLNDTCETIAPEFGSMAGRSGVQVLLVDHRKFGSVLCHHCKLCLGAQVTEVRV